MPSESIRLAVDRRDRPIVFTEKLWSSDDTPWSGFRLERHRIGPLGQLDDFGVPTTLLGLCIRGSASLRFGSDLHAQQVVVRPGRFTLLAESGAQPPIRWAGSRETLYLSMARGEIERLVGEDEARGTGPTPGGLVPQFGLDDPQVARLMLSMLDEVRAGCPSGDLYGEALSIALAQYLFNRYGRRERRLSRPGPKLPGAMAERVVDYVESHLAENVSLAQLAALVGLSPHHFSMVFKNTFDSTPHRYLMQRRVERAKRLLVSRDVSIGEAALDAGFSNQSHFTRIFRRITGETPGQYKQSRH